jgi:hypothetical protein
MMLGLSGRCCFVKLITGWRYESDSKVIRSYIAKMIVAPALG